MWWHILLLDALGTDARLPLLGQAGFWGRSRVVASLRLLGDTALALGMKIALELSSGDFQFRRRYEWLTAAMSDCSRLFYSMVLVLRTSWSIQLVG